MLKDMAERPVSEGDWLVEERGKLYRVTADDGAGVALCDEYRTVRGKLRLKEFNQLVRVYHCFVGSGGFVGRPQDIRKMWQELFDYHKIADRMRIDIKARRDHIAELKEDFHLAKE